MSTTRIDHQGREMFPRPADPAYISTGEVISLILDLRLGPGAGNERRPVTTADGRFKVSKPKRMAQQHRDAHEDVIDDLARRRYLAYIEQASPDGGVSYREAAYREFWSSPAGRESVTVGRLITDANDPQSGAFIFVRVADIRERYDRGEILQLRSGPDTNPTDGPQGKQYADEAKIRQALEPLLKNYKDEGRHLGPDAAYEELKQLPARRSDVRTILPRMTPRRTREQGRPTKPKK